MGCDPVVRRANEFKMDSPYFARGRLFLMYWMRVLPVAEMQFCGYPSDKPKILGFRAKVVEL
jgi:hypothetical protein